LILKIIPSLKNSELDLSLYSPGILLFLLLLLLLLASSWLWRRVLACLQFLNDGSSFRHTQIENMILCFLVAFKQNLEEGREGK
jgi:hypothetical protein